MTKLDEAGPGETPVRSHQCVALKQGDWVIHRCLECDYELRNNSRTGEWSIMNAKPYVEHTGYVPVGLRASIYPPN